MTISNLINREDLNTDQKLKNIFLQLNEIIKELNTKDLPDSTKSVINVYVDAINSSLFKGKDLIKLLKSGQTQILKMLAKEHKIVPKNYYRNLWLALGMSAFGIPFGVAIGVSLGNLGLLGVGLPIGMGIGITIGMAMDKKTLENGKQLNCEIKY